MICFTGTVVWKKILRRKMALALIRYYLMTAKMQEKKQAGRTVSQVISVIMTVQPSQIQKPFWIEKIKPASFLFENLNDHFYLTIKLLRAGDFSDVAIFNSSDLAPNMTFFHSSHIPAILSCYTIPYSTCWITWEKRLWEALRIKYKVHLHKKKEVIIHQGVNIHHMCLMFTFNMGYQSCMCFWVLDILN